MKIYALANELNLDRSNAGTITIPFGTWDYGEKKLDDGRTVFFRQTLNSAGAKAIVDQIAASIAKGEKGVPVYWGHPDVPELAHKYPDKRAKGWIKEAKVEADGLILTVEWLEENATEGFGWFSPYWTGTTTENGSQAMMNVNALASVALVNMPNIQEFRLANELQDGLNSNERTFAMPQHLIDLAKRFDERVRLANEANYDESKHPRAEDGKFTSAGGGGSGGKRFDEHKPFHTSDGGGFMRDTQSIAEDAAHKAARAKGSVRNPATRAERARSINDDLAFHRNEVKGKGAHKDFEWREAGYKSVRATHRAAMYLGLKYNRATHQYE